jgi:hypothetical protein
MCVGDGQPVQSGNTRASGGIEDQTRIMRPIKSGGSDEPIGGCQDLNLEACSTLLYDHRVQRANIFPLTEHILD